MVLDPTTASLETQVADRERLRAEVDRLSVALVAAYTAAEALTAERDRLAAECERLQNRRDWPFEAAHHDDHHAREEHLVAELQAAKAEVDAARKLVNIHDACRDSAEREVDRIAAELQRHKEAATAQLRYDTQAVLTGTPENRTRNELRAMTADRDRLVAELLAATREADRLRHGMAVEGDFVCPDSLALNDARAESQEAKVQRDRLRALVEEACGELDDTGGEFARQRAEEISAEAEALVPEKPACRCDDVDDTTNPPSAVHCPAHNHAADADFEQGYDQAVDEICDHFAKAGQPEVVRDICRIFLSPTRTGHRSPVVKGSP